MSIDVTAKRWKRGWELYIDGVGVTQSRTLASAPQMVRDYIESLTGKAVTGEVCIRPDLGGLETQVIAAREHTERAQRESRLAASESRQVAKLLRKSGLSLDDTGRVLGVSKARATQLLSGREVRP